MIFGFDNSDKCLLEIANKHVRHPTMLFLYPRLSLIQAVRNPLRYSETQRSYQILTISVLRFAVECYHYLKAKNYTKKTGGKTLFLKFEIFKMSQV